MKSIIVFICAVLVSIPLHSQAFLDKVAKKTKYKLEKKAEEKAEEKAIEKVEESLEEEEDESSPSRSSDEVMSAYMMNKMGISSEPIPIADKYSFESSVSSNIRTYKSNGELESDGDLITYVNPGMRNFAYEFISGDIETSTKDQKGIFILDFENKATIILTDDNDEKAGLVYGIKDYEDPEEYSDYETMDAEEVPDDHAWTNPNVKKTGRTKNILGYKCEEYKYEDEEVEANYWITKNYNWKSNDYMSSVFRSSMYSHGMPYGFLMLSESIDKQTKEKTIYEVTDINENAKKTFNMSDYQVTNFGNITMPEESDTSEEE